MNTLHLICECHSYSHQMFFWKDEDEFYVTTHLNSGNFWQRLRAGIRYIFGYKSNFGEWDEFLISPENEFKLRLFLQGKEQFTVNETD